MDQELSKKQEQQSQPLAPSHFWASSSLATELTAASSSSGLLTSSRFGSNSSTLAPNPSHPIAVSALATAPHLATAPYLTASHPSSTTTAAAPSASYLHAPAPPIFHLHHRTSTEASEATALNPPPCSHQPPPLAPAPHLRPATTLHPGPQQPPPPAHATPSPWWYPPDPAARQQLTATNLQPLQHPPASSSSQPAPIQPWFYPQDPAVSRQAAPSHPSAQPQPAPDPQPPPLAPASSQPSSSQPPWPAPAAAASPPSLWPAPADPSASQAPSAQSWPGTPGAPSPSQPPASQPWPAPVNPASSQPPTPHPSPPALDPSTSRGPTLQPRPPSPPPSTSQHPFPQSWPPPHAPYTSEAAPAHPAQPSPPPSNPSSHPPSPHMGAPSQDPSTAPSTASLPSSKPWPAPLDRPPYPGPPLLDASTSTSQLWPPLVGPSSSNSLPGLSSHPLTPPMSLATTHPHEVSQPPMKRSRVLPDTPAATLHHRPPSPPPPSPGDVVHLNVRGQFITVKRSTLCHVPGSLLETMFSGRWDSGLERDSQGRVFLEYNPACFQVVVDCLSHARAHDQQPPLASPLVASEQLPEFLSLLQYLGLQDAVQPAVRAVGLRFNSTHGTIDLRDRKRVAEVPEAAAEGGLPAPTLRVKASALAVPLLPSGASYWKLYIHRLDTTYFSGMFLGVTAAAATAPTGYTTSCHGWQAAGGVVAQGQLVGDRRAFEGWEEGDNVVMRLEAHRGVLSMVVDRLPGVYQLRLRGGPRPPGERWQLVALFFTEGNCIELMDPLPHEMDWLAAAGLE